MLHVKTYAANDLVMSVNVYCYFHIDVNINGNYVVVLYLKEMCYKGIKREKRR